jgi:hypothetical protein
LARAQVHSLDIITMRTREGVKTLTVLLWTDCETWSSHSCTAGYLVDVLSETIVANAAWYAPAFVKQSSNLLGKKLPGVREACKRANAAHEASTLPWLSTVGWDAMLTPEGVCCTPHLPARPPACGSCATCTCALAVRVLVIGPLMPSCSILSLRG